MRTPMANTSVTQTVNLWLSNEQEHYEAVLELMHISSDKYDFAQRLKLFVEDELYLQNTYNQHFINDMLAESLSYVNWVVISDSWWSEWKEESA